MSGRAVIRLAPLLAVAAAITACGSSARPSGGIPPSLLRAMRPIGVGPGFHEPARGPVAGRCRAALGPRVAAHLELFAANRVVIVPAGIGTRGPRRESAGEIVAARCYGDVVTLGPTGIVLARTGLHVTLATLFRSWGEPLSSTRLASFHAPAGTSVAVYIGGRRRSPPSPGDVKLSPHAEIVLEVGPHVPPHASFTFPPTP